MANIPLEKSPTKQKSENERISKKILQRNRKKKKARKESYRMYIHKVLKKVHPDIGVTNKSMNAINAFVNDVFERIANEASRLAKNNDKQTISSREIQTAVRLILPGELARHAASEGSKAVSKYEASK